MAIDSEPATGGHTWKKRVLENFRLGKVYEPRLEDYILLLLYLDGRTPIYGEEVVHFILTIYPYAEVELSPSFFLPYSAIIENKLGELIEKKLAYRLKQNYRGTEKNIIKITEGGSDEARRLFKLFSESWLLVHNTVLRQGSEVLNELEALKKTYNGKSVTELIGLLASKLDAEGTFFIQHLSANSPGWMNYVYYLARQISKEKHSINPF